MGTRVMNEYSYTEGQYSLSKRQDENTTVRQYAPTYEVQRRDTSQNGEFEYTVILFRGRFEGA